MQIGIAHPLHPLNGREHVLAGQHLNWGEDRVSYHDADGVVAQILNGDDLYSGTGCASARIVGNIRRSHGLKDRFTRLRANGMLTVDELAAQLGVLLAVPAVTPRDELRYNR